MTHTTNRAARRAIRCGHCAATHRSIVRVRRCAARDAMALHEANSLTYAESMGTQRGMNERWWFHRWYYGADFHSWYVLADGAEYAEPTGYVGVPA